jgi:hypothetical protein
MDEFEMLRTLYRDFNARRIEEVLERMIPGVEWPNGMEGGWVHGTGEVRAYWLRQFTLIDPHVEPLSIERDAEGRFEVRVHQTVRDLEGKLLQDREVRHCYTIRDGLIERMEIFE